VLGRFAPLPRVYSDSLQRIIALMLRVNPKDRPNTTQLLSMPDVSTKAEMMETEGFRAHNPADNALLGTIKVPPLLKRLNEALPKPCYPDARPEGRLESRSSKEENNGMPKPPLPPVDLSQVRRPLAPINSDRPKAPVTEVSARPPQQPRPPAGGPTRMQYQHRAW
jgi:hypothetical protein